MFWPHPRARVGLAPSLAKCVQTRRARWQILIAKHQLWRVLRLRPLMPPPLCGRLFRLSFAAQTAVGLLEIEVCLCLFLVDSKEQGNHLLPTVAPVSALVKIVSAF